MADPKIDKFKKVLQMDPNDETLWFGQRLGSRTSRTWGTQMKIGKRPSPPLNRSLSCLKVKPTYSAASVSWPWRNPTQGDRHANQPERCRTVCALLFYKASTSPPPTATCSYLHQYVFNLEELRDSLP